MQQIYDIKGINTNHSLLPDNILYIVDILKHDKYVKRIHLTIIEIESMLEYGCIMIVESKILTTINYKYWLNKLLEWDKENLDKREE